MVCVPLYTVDKPSIRREFVIGAQAFQFPSKFYLPPQPLHHIEEAIARFELIQTAHVFAAKRFPDEKNPVMLTDEFIALLRINLSSYLGANLDGEKFEILKLYGDDVLAESRKLGIKI